VQQSLYSYSEKSDKVLALTPNSVAHKSGDAEYLEPSGLIADLSRTVNSLIGEVRALIAKIR